MVVRDNSVGSRLGALRDFGIRRRFRFGRANFQRRRSREGGYNLVFLVVISTVLTIMISKALPLWSAVIQREKEEELIFRGMQYAEALRVYEMRHGGLPTKLEQLIEVEPRCIRQLWTNPMAEDGSWELIPFGRGQRVRGQNRGQDLGLSQDEQDEDEFDPELDQGRRPGEDPDGPDPSLLWIPGGENEIGGLPIAGVKSSVGGDAIKIFMINPNAPGDTEEESDIADWEFTVDLAKALIVPPDPSKGTVPSMNVEQRFKPWPPGIRPLNIPNAGGGRRDGQGRNVGGGISALETPGQRNSSGGNRGDG